MSLIYRWYIDALVVTSHSMISMIRVNNKKIKYIYIYIKVREVHKHDGMSITKYTKYTNMTECQTTKSNILTK